MNLSSSPTTSVTRWVLPLLLAGLLANVVAWLTLGILPDEAYYWVWSERLQAGYFDHAPLIAWLIRPFTALFGANAPVIRLPSVLGWLVGVGLAFDLARRLYGPTAGWLAVLAWATLPIVQVGFHINTPDTPLVLFSWLTFYFAVRALADERPAWWYAAGASAGLCMLGKYPGLLVPVAVLGGLVFSAEGRRHLATRGPWLGAVLAAVIVSPMVIWNALHDWISFGFQFGHGVQARADAPLAMAGQFLAGQLAVALPWTWFAMAFAALPTRAHRTAGPAFWVLAAGFWLPLVVFGLAGLTAKSHPNWPVSAYVPGVVLLAGVLAHWIGRRAVVATIIGSVLFSYLLVNLIRFPHWVAALGVPLPPQRTQLSQAYGWEQVGEAVKARLTGREDCLVVGDRLQGTAMLALLIGDTRRVIVSNATRLNQFHLWQRENPPAVERLCLYVAQFEEDKAPPVTLHLPEQGNWRLDQVITHHNPDASVRKTALYVPVLSP